MKGAKEWLLCYFQRPALAEEWFEAEDILMHFPDAKITPQGEYTIRATTQAEADEIASFVLSRLS